MQGQPGCAMLTLITEQNSTIPSHCISPVVIWMGGPSKSVGSTGNVLCCYWTLVRKPERKGVLVQQTTQQLSNHVCSVSDRMCKRVRLSLRPTRPGRRGKMSTAKASCFSCACGSQAIVEPGGQGSLRSAEHWAEASEILRPLLAAVAAAEQYQCLPLLGLSCTLISRCQRLLRLLSATAAPSVS